MKKTIIAICTLLAYVSGAFADDAFSVDNVTLPQNGEADVTVRFSLDQGSTCSGYTFWLQVPEELAFVTYEKNEKTYVTYTAGDCYDETPTLTPNIDGDYLKVACLTANSDPLNKQSGVLVTFRIKVNAAVTVGDSFTGTLTNGTISPENGSMHDVANTSFTITIVAPADTRTVLDETSTTAPEAATGVDVRVKRTIKANEWSTLCLPFAMTAAQVTEAFGNDVQLAEFTGWETTEYNNDDDPTAITVSFNDVTAIEANTPYIIKVSSPVSEFTVDGVDIDSDDEPGVTVGKKSKGTFGSFTGSYVPMLIDEECLFLSDNKFWYSTGATRMKGFRAYFYFQDVLADYDGATSARIGMVLTDEAVTGISEMMTKRHGESERYYNLKGQQVDSPSKGLYIKDGKKMVVK